MTKIWLFMISMLLYRLVEGIVKLENNKYTGIVIAINPSVSEDHDLIDSIIESWTEASSALFTATKNRAYIGEVTILLPSNWTYSSAELAGNETYDKADAIIAKENPSYGDAPYTLQLGGCGQPGSYIHFTPNYFLDDSMITNYGPREKVIVHEWAHYRWGVFDETSETDPFYIDPDDDANVLCDPQDYNNCQTKTQCPRAIKICCTEDPNPSLKCDDEELDIGRPTTCNTDSTTGLFTQDCVCYASDSDGVFNASLMSYQYIEPIVSFCEDGNGRNFHNADAPNDQNRLCNRKSTWTVIMESNDFTSGNSPVSIPDTTPKFNIKRAEGYRRFVLVMDVSGSMSTADASTGQTRIQQISTSANYFITSVPNGSYVGIVTFESTSSIISSLVKLETPEERKNLAAKLPVYASGGTCIGCGIQRGIEVLENYGPPEGGQLIVMTDGEETTYPFVRDVRDEVLDKTVVVQSLIVYTVENADLVSLSEDSGGQWFFAGSNDLQAFVESYNQMLDPTDGDDTKKTLQLMSETFIVDNVNDEYTTSVYIDDTIGNNTVFTYTWSYGGEAERPIIELIPFSGCIYTTEDTKEIYHCSENPTISEGYKTIRFEIPGTAQTGSWESRVKKRTSNSQTVVVFVTSMAADKDTPPIMVASVLSQKNYCPLVYATVTQGLNPVLGAHVEAALAKEGEGSSTYDLYDNGAEPDIRRNDGVYSRYLCTGSIHGRYSVKVKVYSKSDGSVVESSVRHSRATYNPGVIDENGNLVPNPNGPTLLPRNVTFGIDSSRLGNFSRQISPGAFEYTPPTPPPTGGGTTSSDMFSPSKVFDLKAAQNDFTNYTKGIVLTFTAPGDDFDSGKASKYEIRYNSEDMNALLSSFESNAEIYQDTVTEGNISDPSMAGTIERIVINVKNYTNHNIFSIGYAIRATDKAGNQADISNVAIIRYYFEPPKFALPPDTTSSPYESTLASTNETSTIDSSTEARTEASTTTKLPTVLSTKLTPFSTEKPSKRNLYIGIGILLLVLVASLGTAVSILICWLCCGNKSSSKSSKPNRSKPDRETIENPYADAFEMRNMENGTSKQYGQYHHKSTAIPRPSSLYA
uniref:calcium-activated chloride channel regulator 1-like n=1 Tax=Styela clava TaxID=7725 RepID=UPI00193AD8C2|nr:calcium-activated chloride channel regulator 1-like [Styela clava]